MAAKNNGICLSLNKFLESGGIPLTRTRVVRHSPLLHEKELLLDLARAKDPLFETYQAEQGRDVFRNTQFVASFLALPARKCVLVGVWEILGVRKNIMWKAVTQPKPRLMEFVYLQRRVKGFDTYIDRLIINWSDSPSAARAWVQRCDRNDKEIVELRPVGVSPWPGFDQFECRLADVPVLPDNWKQVLRTTVGAYLLVDERTGLQYVGAAYGDDGFFGRWLAHLQNRGDAARMRKLVPEKARLLVLEVASLRARGDDVLALEKRWKQRLGSRAHGLNAN